MELKFEWDNNKNKANQRKHGISFEEAITVFNDPLSINYDDPDHSTEENRYIIIGLSNQGRLIKGLMSFPRRRESTGFPPSRE